MTKEIKVKWEFTPYTYPNDPYSVPVQTGPTVIHTGIVVDFVVEDYGVKAIIIEDGAFFVKNIADLSAI